MNIKKFFLVLSLVAILLTATVASAGAASPVHVTRFHAAYSTGSIKTSVGVANGAGTAVAGAKVQISYEKEGVPIMLLNAMTNANGIAHFSGAVTSGKWLVCVEEIHKIGYVYNPARALCTSIIVP